MGRRKGNVKYIDTSDGLLSGDLGGIDHRRRLDHIDYLSKLLLVRERDIDIRRAGLDRRQAERIESFLLNAQLVGSGGEIGELAVTGKIGGAAKRKRMIRCLQNHDSGRDGHAVFISDRDYDAVRRRLWRPCGRLGESNLGKHEKKPTCQTNRRWAPSIGYSHSLYFRSGKR